VTAGGPPAHGLPYTISTTAAAARRKRPAVCPRHSPHLCLARRLLRGCLAYSTFCRFGCPECGTRRRNVYYITSSIVVRAAGLAPHTAAAPKGAQERALRTLRQARLPPTIQDGRKVVGVHGRGAGLAQFLGPPLHPERSGARMVLSDPPRALPPPPPCLSFSASLLCTPQSLS